MDADADHHAASTSCDASASRSSHLPKALAIDRKRVKGARRRSLVPYSSKKTPLRSRPITERTFEVVFAGCETKEKPGGFADRSICTADRLIVPVKRCIYAG